MALYYRCVTEPALLIVHSETRESSSDSPVGEGAVKKITWLLLRRNIVISDRSRASPGKWNDEVATGILLIWAHRLGAVLHGQYMRLRCPGPIQ